ncbi:MAG: TolC family protein [Phycisphaeraceae bacterium]|nr:TolC family protein [Phycisphaeraceae bacterium]
MCKQIFGALVLTAAVAGCQSHRPVPLKLAEHAEAFARREADAEGVRAYARRLTAREPDADGFDLSDGLSAREAEAVALFYNADLRVLRAESNVARATVRHAGAWQEPHLEGELLRFTRSVPDRWIRSVGVQFTLPISGRLAVEKDQATADLGLSRARVRSAEWQVLGQVRRMWIRWATVRQRQDLVQANLEELSGLRAVVEKMVEAGELDPTDLGALKIQEATLRLSLGRLIHRAASRRLELIGLMGLKADANLALVPKLPKAMKDTSPSDRPLLAHPRMIAAKARYERAEQNLRREIHKQYPDLEIGPTYEREEGQSRIGLSGGIPIPSINLNQQGIAEAKAEREVARVEAHRTYEKLSSALAAARLEVRAARRRREVLVGQLMPVVKRQRRQLKTLIGIGELNVLMMSQVLQQDLQIKTDLLETAAAEASASQAIEGLIGPHWFGSAMSVPKESQP